MKPLLIAAAIAATIPSLGAVEPTTAPPAAVKNWRDARFGMFIHWGPVSLKGTEIGWSRGQQVPIDEYDNLYKRFNPVKFDANAWVATAKAAGMKYVVLTTKHHDGFCLWDTKQTDYNITQTPFKRDVVKELAAACKKAGIAFGAYYSTCDWHHPAFPNGSPGGQSRKPHPDMKAYDAYLSAQCEELIRNYGPLFTIWFDVPQSYTTEYGVPLINKLRALQPDIMLNNRAYNDSKGDGNGVAHHNTVGDYDTPEQKIGGFQMDRPWETCMTICNQWAWKPNDSMKSLQQCLHALLLTTGGDGNLLFNVGPTPDGEIEARQIDRLKEMGAWLTKNGEAIYGTRGGPWKPTKQLVSTRKDHQIYLHFLTKPNSQVTLPALPAKITSAKLLNGAAITFKQSADSLDLDLPADNWDEIDTIVELTLTSPAIDIAPIDVTAASIPGAKASASAFYRNDPSYGPMQAIDGDPATRWATVEGTRQCWLQLDLAKPTTITGITINEALATPKSRVLKFEIQALSNHGTWTTIHTGQAIGAKFSTPLPKTTTKAIRLNILDATEGPTISEIRLGTTTAP